MNTKHLAIYLNDHLAGSTSGIELLNHLISTHGGTPLGQVLGELREEIEQDRAVLRQLMRALAIPESPVRTTAAWLSEKVARLKLRVEDPAAGALTRLEQLEALSLGIEGKRSLWRALAAAAPGLPPLQAVDLAELEQRAERQRQRVEPHRLEAAQEAFARGA